LCNSQNELRVLRQSAENFGAFAKFDSNGGLAEFQLNAGALDS